MGAKKYKGIKTVAEQAKEFGAKVKREFRGYYVYKGVNFTAEFCEQSCEKTWWEVEVYNDNVDKRIFDQFSYGGGGQMNEFERKTDVVWALLCFDKSLSVTDEA